MKSLVDISEISTESSCTTIQDTYTTIQPNFIDKTSIVVQVFLGILILIGNALILVGFRQSSTLSKLTRLLLANIAVADFLLGVAIVSRGILGFSEADVAYYCPHLLGFMACSVVVVYGTTAIVGTNTYCILCMKTGYNKKAALRIGVAALVLVWMAGIGCYLVLVLGQLRPAGPVTSCSGTAGFTPPYLTIGSAIFCLLALLYCVTLQALSGRETRKTLKIHPNGKAGNARLQLSVINSHRESPFTKSTLLTGTGSNPEPRYPQPSSSYTTTAIPHGQGQRHHEHAQDEQGHQEIEKQKEICIVKGASKKVKRSKSSPGHVFKIVLIVTMITCVFVTPAIIVQLLGAIAPEVLADKLWLPSTFFTATIVSSVANVAVYFVKDPSFRQRIKAVFSTCISSFR